MQNVKSSSAETSASQQSSAALEALSSSSAEMLDRDALDALDFAQRGRPDSEIGYSAEALRLTSEQLDEFEAASFRFEHFQTSSGLRSDGPVRRTNQLILDDGATQLIIAAYETGVVIVHGWTVSISLDQVITYVSNSGRNDMADVNGGFFFLHGDFVISHAGAKLTLRADEGTAIVKFMSEFYGLI